MTEQVNFIDDEIGFEIRKLHLIINREFEKYKCKEMPTKLQFAVIFYIDHNEKLGKDTYQRDIEKQFEIRASTATELLRKMESEGLLLREDDKNDKRMKKLLITEKTKKIKEEFFKHYLKLRAKLYKNLTKEEIQAFVKVAQKLQNNLLEDDNA